METEEVPFVNDERLRKEERLLNRKDYARVRRKSERYVTRSLVALASPGPTPWTRAGLIVSKKVGRAHTRNLVKRRLRAIFRQNKAALPPGYDLVWIARRAAVETPYADLLKEAIEASGKAAAKAARRRL